MFSILIVIFYVKFINYFVKNNNYNKNNNISKTKNNMQNPRTTESRLLMENPIELGPYARPIDRGS